MLMDFVPKSSRGRWNAVDSVTKFGWSGSAFIGGFLIDKYGYGYTFLITATLQFIGYSLLFPLIYIIPPENKFSPAIIQPLLSHRKTPDGEIEEDDVKKP